MKNAIYWCLVILFLTGCSSSVSRKTEKILSQYDAAATAYQNGELSEAEARYVELLRKNPNYAEGWFKLGNIYIRTGQYEAAIIVYQKAAKINPENTKVWNNLALAHVKKAVAVLDEGVGHLPESSSDRRALLALREQIVQSVISENPSR